MLGDKPGLQETKICEPFCCGWGRVLISELPLNLLSGSCLTFCPSYQRIQLCVLLPGASGDNASIYLSESVYYFNGVRKMVKSTVKLLTLLLCLFLSYRHWME